MNRTLVTVCGLLAPGGSSSVLDNVDVVKILQVGATGFALLMLWFGYNLVKVVVNQTPADTKPAQEAYARKARLAYVFLFVSLLFAGVGLTGQLFLRTQENQVTVGVTPAAVLRAQHRVQVLHGLSGVTLNDVGRGIVFIRHQDELTFDMTEIENEQVSLNTGRATAAAAKSAEVGFDEAQ